MKQELKEYKRIQEDLFRQIDLSEQYKAEIKETVETLQRRYESGSIDRETYVSKLNEFLEGKSPEEWYSVYDNHIMECQKSLHEYTDKINEIAGSLDKERSLSSKALIFVSLFLVLSLLFFIKSPITGLLVYEGYPTIISEDGYSVEGSQWVEIKGSRLYERCLKVNSESEFDSVNVIAKITSAVDTKDLRFKLYKNDGLRDEPVELISSCKVSDYDNLWKSCTINHWKQEKDSYWVCASTPSGNREETQYTIGYNVGGSRKTALWTGKNWQKLDRYSYTIKAQFMKNEE